MITNFNFDQHVPVLPPDVTLQLQSGVYLFCKRSSSSQSSTSTSTSSSSSSSSSQKKHYHVQRSLENSTFVKYSHTLLDSHNTIHIQLMLPDTVWRIDSVDDDGVFFEDKKKDFVVALCFSDRLCDVEYLMSDLFPHPLTVDIDSFSPLKPTSTLLEYYNYFGLLHNDDSPTNTCLKFTIVKQIATNRWTLSRTLQTSRVSQPAIEPSSFIQCTNELALLSKNSRTSAGFLDPTPSGFIVEANKVAGQISTSLEVFNKVTSYSGNAADALKKFNFDFGALVVGLEYI
ncbi:hypothetical protein BDR26DRAFT_921252, partial [Obelidium mucronatum]